MCSPGNPEDVDRFPRMMPDAWPVFFHNRRPRSVQLEAMPLILRGESVFLSGPTASGKTEAAVAPLYQRHVSFRRRKLGVVYIAPTKALVNDINCRISEYLGGVSGPAGVFRYTGDHHEFPGPGNAFLLVITPEALDSIQLMRPDYFDHVRAVVVDEIHFLHGAARGQQLRAVITRIRQNIHDSPDTRDCFQVVAMSATMSDRENVRRLWAGYGAHDVIIEEKREIEMTFLNVHEGKNPETVFQNAGLLRSFLDQENIGKVIFFANSRNEAHLYSVALNRVFSGTKWPVYLHIGILTAAERDRVEEGMKRESAGICVATSTLEVGIDIGDVDMIALLSPPHSVSGFLQRIGRGNRRTGRCRVAAISRNSAERTVYSSLLALAQRGELDEIHEYERPSVRFQQVLSLAWRGMRLEKPLTLENLTERSGEDSNRDVAEDMIREGHLRNVMGALIPSEELIEEGDCRRIHSVIAGGSARPVVDPVTGETVAVMGKTRGEGAYFLGGKERGLSLGRDERMYLEGGMSGRKLSIGRIPASFRGRNGLSRILVWEICRHSGGDPLNWMRDGDRVVTWGGGIFNRLLAVLCVIEGIADKPRVDDFGISGIPEQAVLSPSQVMSWISEGKAFQKLKQEHTVRFRGASRYYNLLSGRLKTKEAVAAVPVEEFTRWIDECRRLEGNLSATVPED